MKPLPMPLRVAAGLVATAVEQARELPRIVVELPVTAVSQAMQASMRLQQKVTELAIKGDRALSMWRPAPESPTWAHFDDDETPDAPRSIRSAGPGAVARIDEETDVRDNGAVTELRPSVPTPAAPADPAADRRDPLDVADPLDVLGPRAVAPKPTGGAAPLPGYDDMTIAQLRARLRRLSVETLRDLLIWETANRNRPPFVTMLSNRITTVTADG